VKTELKIAEENEPHRTQRGGAATQTRPRNASHKEAQKAQKGIPFVALVPFCGQENLVGLKRFGGIAVQRKKPISVPSAFSVFFVV